MHLQIIDHGSIQHQEMVDLRFQLLRKPLGLTFSSEELTLEKKDILIGFFDEEKLAGCCILTKEDEKTIRLRQMAVHSGIQGKGIGRLIVTFAEELARNLGYTKLQMHARKTVQGFYEKLGYEAESPEFEEVTIPHITMGKCL